MYKSPVYDMLNAVFTFGLCDEVKNMIYRGHTWSRTLWGEKLPKRAWDLDDTYWCLKTRCHKSLDLLSNVCITSRYLIWWQLADKYFWLSSDCEIMTKILCHSSLLKTDDVRLKSLPMASRFCSLCDLG